MVCYPWLGKIGRFGNHLFQIAATYSHAIDCETQALFPAWEHDKIFKNKLNYFINPPYIENQYKERYFYYEPIPKLSNLSLIGFFQSEKYFLNNKDKVLEQFTFKDELNEKVYLKYKHLLDQNPVGVQIRSYTHKSLDHRDIHWDVFDNPDYLKQAFSYFGKDRLYVIISDNYELTKSKLPYLENLHIINSSSEDFYEDFILFTFCKDYIISASSFGWWGAYLSKNKERKIIMPNKWFRVNDIQHDTRDLYPQGVIRF